MLEQIDKKDMPTDEQRQALIRAYGPAVKSCLSPLVSLLAELLSRQDTWGVVFVAESASATILSALAQARAMQEQREQPPGGTLH